MQTPVDLVAEPKAERVQSYPLAIREDLVAPRDKKGRKIHPIARRSKEQSQIQDSLDPDFRSPSGNAVSSHRNHLVACVVGIFDCRYRPTHNGAIRIGFVAFDL